MAHEDFEAIAALDAIGAATADEERTLREHLSSCIPCRRARDEYAEAAAMMARELEPVAPPSDVRERVFEDVTPVAASEEERGFFGRWGLATAATLFLALWGWREIGIRVMREHVRSQQADIQRLANEKQVVELERQKLEAAVASLAAANTQTISLTGAQMSPSASAKVFMDSDKHRAVVVFANLPKCPTDKSYQFWIIRGDQPKPQSAGVFDVEKGNATITIENLPVMTEIKGLALTMEPRGGVEQPTNANYYVVGKT
ncbi:MAG TPA: anti-sigma factor [Thermoanaerobaculia bacterium]|jgi:anti-sigma-K factor RskA